MATKSRRKTSTTRERSSRGKIVSVDFSGTDSRGGAKGSRSYHFPPNDYAAKVKSAELAKSSEKETPEVKVVYVVTKGKYKGKTIIDDLYLTKKALWRVRQTWEAAGIKVPSSKVKLNPAKIVGKEVAITIDDDEYENKVRSRVVDTYKLSEFEELQENEDEDLEEDEDEEDDEGEDEEDEEDEDEEEDEEDEEDDDELEDVDLDEI